MMGCLQIEMMIIIRRNLRKGAPNENNSYSTDEVKRLRWLVDDEGGWGLKIRTDKRIKEKKYENYRSNSSKVPIK